MAILRSATSVLLFVANLLLPIAILQFAVGFFPYKPFLPGLATYDILRRYGDIPRAPFNKVVFMVVDALRSDFVYSPESGFSFTQRLINDGFALPFTAHATAPTITMPRIKAITTGSTPSFLDLILNFAESDTSSTLAAQDTWLAQMKAKRTGKMVMYGDDTWLKLFPETFDRADGTSSFFVADFTEVDNNVTRHIPEELRNDDWNTMILHYLGLDHIGHKAGPRSPNMIPKQREMDGIVKMIYESMESEKHLEKTLLVLCGDHGMNDVGNHGGSAPGETSPALVFISPKLKKITSDQVSPLPISEDFQYYKTVEQSDIAPTLAGLLDFPVPRNNLGSFIVDFLPIWWQGLDRLQILQRNAQQILKIVTIAFPTESFEGPAPNDCSDLSIDIERLSCEWKKIQQQLKYMSFENRPRDFENMLKDITKWTRDAQGIMSGAATSYDMVKLVAGVILAAVSSIVAAIAAYPIIAKSPGYSTPFLLMTLFYGIMMFASSYIEEEHNFWYWAASGWLVFLAMRGSGWAFPPLTILGGITLAALRITRRWNQTGQKFAGEPDIARTFLSQHTTLLWILIVATYACNCYQLSHMGFPTLSRSLARPIAVVLTILALTFKLAFEHEDSPELLDWTTTRLVELTAGPSLVFRARAVFIGIALALAYTIGIKFVQDTRGDRIASSYTIHYLISLFLITQSRASNIPLFLLFFLQLSLLNELNSRGIGTTTTSILFQYLSFFAFGGTNAISSVDLSSAYNGVSGFNVLAVGLLTFVSNWAGPIFWTSGMVILLRKVKENMGSHVLRGHIALLTVFTSFSVLAVMVACTVLRTHLFIWTVFSPKYLYSMAWSFGQHLFINIGLGSLLFWLAGK